MIVLDANILIYAYDSGSSQHTKARAWVEQTFSGLESVGLPWQTVSAFLRVMTNTRLPGTRLSLEQAARDGGSVAGAAQHTSSFAPATNTGFYFGA